MHFSASNLAHSRNFYTDAVCAEMKLIFASLPLPDTTMSLTKGVVKIVMSWQFCTLAMFFDCRCINDTLFHIVSPTIQCVVLTDCPQ